MNARVEAVEFYTHAMRTGEAAAAERAAKYLGKDIVLCGDVAIVGPTEDIKGHAEVLKRITGS